MKKLLIISSLILSSPVWAQTYIQNARTVNDIAASSYQIAPGVSVSPPMWSRNLGNNNGYSGNNTNSTGNSNNTNAISKGELNPGIIPAPNNTNGGANVSVNVPSGSNPKPNQEANFIEAKPANVAPQINSVPLAAPKPLPKPAIVSGNISSWNRTTQQEIESKANLELQEKYKAFLMQK